MKLRERAPVGLKRQVRSALGVIGVEIGAYTGSFAAHRDHLVRSAGVETVWDVGGYVGEYAAALRRAGYKGRIVSVEPAADAYRRLARRSESDSGWCAIRTAISDECGRRVLHVAGNGQSSSLFAVGARHVAAAPESSEVALETVEVTTLDQLQHEIGCPSPFFIKLDVQGAELSALSGATETLRQVAACEVELSLTDLYEGGATWNDICGLLAGSGFVMCDLERVFFDPESEDLLQVNGLFRRRSAG